MSWEWLICFGDSGSRHCKVDCGRREDVWNKYKPDDINFYWNIISDYQTPS